MKRLRLLLVLSFAAALTACGGALTPPFDSAQGDTAQGDRVASSARSHAPGAISPAASGYKQLYIFKGTPDGASPYSGFVALNGTLYATTLNGSKNYCSQNCGGNNCYLGCGTVFSVTAAGTESVVYNFSGNFNSGSDGSWPFAGLTVLGGAMYGTTSGAGAHRDGTVYTVNGAGSESVLHSFAGGTDGSAPEAALIAYRGKLFGTTVVGGGSGDGTVYSITTGGSEKVLYSFKGGSDGARVYAPVTELNGKLYGVTLEGGKDCGTTGCGTIFELSMKGKKHILYSFSDSGDGAYPNGLTAVGGTLYGTTESGGTKGSGTFFSITPSGTFKTLYNFTDIPDGNLPGASLIYSKGSLYGTTVGGGTSGNGTVFKVTPAGAETVLYSFAGGSDGADPQGPVYLFNRNLYGTTTKGGGTGCGGSGCGTIFKVKP